MKLKTPAFLAAVAFAAFAGTFAGHIAGIRLSAKRVAEGGHVNAPPGDLWPFRVDSSDVSFPEAESEVRRAEFSAEEPDHTLELSGAIQAEMPDAAPEELQAWHEELRHVSPVTAREILRLRKRLTLKAATAE